MGRSEYFPQVTLTGGGGLAVPGDSSGFPNPAPVLTPELGGGGVFLPLELNYLAVFAPNALLRGGPAEPIPLYCGFVHFSSPECVHFVNKCPEMTL